MITRERRRVRVNSLLKMTDSDSENTQTNDESFDTTKNIIETLQESNMIDLMMEEEPHPKILIEQGFRVPPGSLQVQLFLDFLMVLTKTSDLRCIKQRRSEFKFYPKLYKKKLKSKYFNQFDLTGHTFFVGKCDDMDCFIVAEPISDCNCASRCNELGTSGCMLDEPSEIVMEHVILQSLERIDPTILNGKNLTVSDSYENFTESNYAEFNFNDFNQRFFTCFESAWNLIEHPFFQRHKPRLCFTRFGQNILIENHVCMYLI